MNIEAERIETADIRKPEKHGCSPCATDTLFKFSLFILNSQLKNEFLFVTNIASRNQISKYFLMILNKKYQVFSTTLYKRDLKQKYQSKKHLNFTNFLIFKLPNFQIFKNILLNITWRKPF